VTLKPTITTLFWGSVGALAWTHVGYPLAAAVAARLRPRDVDARDELPSVAAIVAAHDEETVIERRLDNLLAQDYPPEQLEIVVASDASTDRTDEIVDEIAAREPRVRLLRCERGGKVAAQNRAVHETTAEILAFTDAATEWAPDALRNLVRSFADREVAYVTGGHVYRAADGTNREGTYWKYEHWLRQNESRLESITGGIGPIYAVRREDYVEVDSRFGHDLAFPYLMVQRGKRAVYDPEALAFEKPSRDLEDEYRRKVRMLEHCWLITLEGGMLRRLPPVYAVEIVSHRHLRYASGVLHLLALGTNVVLVREGLFYRLALGAQLGLLAAAAARKGIARYYVLVTWATVQALVNYLRRGVPATWAPPEGTR
jgi:cellulose synthase/poly-beta-1,6-N-acetylglucosamine synthase-like glycosyltransferase